MNLGGFGEEARGKKRARDVARRELELKLKGS
jgi:hypothetical protein